MEEKNKKARTIQFNRNGEIVDFPIRILEDCEKEPLILNSVFGVYKIMKIGSRKTIQV